jgi:hypothetical protein
MPTFQGHRVKVHLDQVANNPQLSIQTMLAERQALGPLVNLLQIPWGFFFFPT